MTRSSNNDKADNGRIFIIVGILCISSPAIYGDTSTYFYLCYTTINVGMCKAMCITTQHQLQQKIINDCMSNVYALPIIFFN